MKKEPRITLLDFQELIRLTKPNERQNREFIIPEELRIDFCYAFIENHYTVFPNELISFEHLYNLFYAEQTTIYGFPYRFDQKAMALDFVPRKTK